MSVNCSGLWSFLLSAAHWGTLFCPWGLAPRHAIMKPISHRCGELAFHGSIIINQQYHPLLCWSTYQNFVPTWRMIIAKNYGIFRVMQFLHPGAQSEGGLERSHVAGIELDVVVNSFTKLKSVKLPLSQDAALHREIRWQARVVYTILYIICVSSHI